MSDRPIHASKSIHLVGDFAGRSSLSRCTRDLHRCLTQAGFEVEMLDIPLSPERFTGRATIRDVLRSAPVPASSVSILHCNADTLEFVAQELGDVFFADRYIIGIWYWETATLPEHHQKALELVDEIWVTSNFVKTAVEKEKQVPVHHFPYLIEWNHQSPDREETAFPAEVDPERFIFLFSFDYRSCGERKNPQAVCEAFITAFPELDNGRGPICVIKSMEGEASFPIVHAALRRRYRHRPDIIFIDRWLDWATQEALFQRSDCYVSLHRAEGLGLTLMEAMLLDKPCIATAYSGNMDFMTEDNSWLIPYSLEKIGTGAPPFPPHHEWAEPDIAAAAAAMLEVYSDPAAAKIKAAKSSEAIRSNHSFDQVSVRLSTLIAAAKKATPRPKRSVKKGPSARSQAYDQLKSARHLGKELEKKISQIGRMGSTGPLKQATKTLLELARRQNQAISRGLEEIGSLRDRIQKLEGDNVGNTTADIRAMKTLLLQIAAENESTPHPRQANKP